MAGALCTPPDTIPPMPMIQPNSEMRPPRRFLIGRYHEIALKGRNQWRFVDQLKRNLRSIFGGIALGAIRSEGPRLLVELPGEVDDETIAQRAALLFGLQNFSVCRLAPLEIEALTKEAVAAARREPGKSFEVRTRRAEKRFPLNSMEIDRIVGAEVVKQLGLRVDLGRPDFTISIEILPNAAYIAAGKRQGAGGLPVGVAGRAMALLSGGIDSPVAAHRMMRRGLRLDFVHFHSYPLVTAASREKAADLAAHLTRFQGHSTLMLVPFAEVQREIVAGTLRPLRVVLYRRFMLRIATALARAQGASALVTGESLGQVASQTLVNMTVIEQAAGLPILRPLVGMDKNEIVDQARALGTFETSILPDQDCCTLFMPAHPETRADLAEVQRIEQRFDIDRMVADTVRATEKMSFQYPGMPAVKAA
ncbi:MAG: tRNA 4-thiouridine(8) synthase ThiI [Candidatus Binataceae bacterium]|nr:tRNA 4-thiouridine(8) synthase ThiI [Candidatus Binataceae bacterium]